MNMNAIVTNIETRSLDPASAEVWVTHSSPPPTTEIRGRLLGPHCPYTTTIEIAYPLRPLRSEQQTQDALRLRAAIPEASLWDPQTPFLYTVLLELWDTEQRIHQERHSHGLRAFALKSKGLVVNEKVFRLNGRRVTPEMQPNPATALRLRQQGCNLLLAPVTEPAWWPLGDVYGFLMLGQVSDTSEATIASLRTLTKHASCLAWLGRSVLLPALLERLPEVWLACEWDGSPLPVEPRFLVGDSSARVANLPVLFTGTQGDLLTTDLGFLV